MYALNVLYYVFLPIHFQILNELVKYEEAEARYLQDLKAPYEEVVGESFSTFPADLVKASAGLIDGFNDTYARTFATIQNLVQ